MDSTLKKKKKKKTIKCPICKKETQWEGNPYRPFCSKKCKLADLYNWLSEEYKLIEDQERESI
ncbi:MAG: DNA gyrase inhibitor YacG [Thermodesulfobacteria bacterium]|nr:DNA gyrase inhibitor YacG [Thermodesulfobacteriota bacterium]